MARGKHRKSKQNRDISETQAALAAAEAELATEENLHRAALAARAEADALKAELAAACADRDHACQAEIGRLSNEIAALEPWVATMGEMDHRLDDRWAKLVGPLHLALGGGREGTESLVALLTADDVVVLRDGVKANARTTSATVTAIQRARGDRRTLRPQQHYNAAQAQMIKDLVASRLPADDLRARADVVDYEAIEGAVGGAREHSATAVSAWHPIPWIAEPSVDSARAAKSLGLVLDDAHTDFPEGPAIPTQPQATLSAATRNALGSLPTRRVFTEWQRVHAVAGEHTKESRIPMPLAAMPRHAIPADAAALQHWYSAAAWGSALRHAGGPGSSAQSRIAVATQCAVPFWLPPGHTMNYVDSEPLSGDDRTEIRLPYAQVFLALADPMRLDPVAEPSAEFDESWAWMAHTVSDILGRGQKRNLATMLSAGTRGFTTNRIDVCELLEQRGARIEGVVLLADAAGRLDDEFAWCITVPAKSGGVLGRWTLPASLARTEFRDQVINLAAVAAWGDWHSPDADEKGDQDRAAGASNDEPRADGASAVRVLNVKATTRSESGTATGAGTRLSPHIRRGHWRRQRYGPKRSLEKRVRIAPVLVNASRGDIGPRVYRLPVTAAAGLRS